MPAIHRDPARLCTLQAACVEEAADRVTESNDEEGVTLVLEELLAEGASKCGSVGEFVERHNRVRLGDWL